MSLAQGRRIGPCLIVSPLGAGGMGEVYRARDGTLNRDVAIKIIPEEFATDAERFARVTREAQALAALNHPNIAAIYEMTSDKTLDVISSARSFRHAGPIGHLHPGARWRRSAQKLADRSELRLARLQNRQTFANFTLDGRIGARTASLPQSSCLVGVTSCGGPPSN